MCTKLNQYFTRLSRALSLKSELTPAFVVNGSLFKMEFELAIIGKTTYSNISHRFLCREKALEQLHTAHTQNQMR